jgi:hydroxymethylpyrimidine pyrophosphatase-like HAD family hydrolase
VPDAIPYFDQADGVFERLAGARVLFTDLDGTLLGRGAALLADGQGQPSLDAVEAIVAVNCAGLPVVITSGRNAKQLREITRLLGWGDFIAELGCVRSYDHGARLVYETGDWPADVLREGETPYEAIEREGAVELLRKRFPGLIEYHDPWHLDREATHILRGNVPMPAAQSALDELPLPVTIVDNGIIHPRHHHLVGVSEIHAIHLVPTGATKQRSVAAYLADREIAAQRALAIGDSAADVGMAEVVGLMACVANGLADPLLLERAQGHPNVVATHASFGSGWAEFARAWVAARAEAGGR